MTKNENAGVGNDTIHSPKCPHSIVDRSRDRSLLGDVYLNGYSAIFSAQTNRLMFGVLDEDVSQDDPSSFIDKALRHGEADASGSSADESDLPRKEVLAHLDVRPQTQLPTGLVT
jgi:hypothetical protein